MKDCIERFKELYKLEIIERGGSFTPLLLGLFDHILKYEFNDNAEAMDEFIQSLTREDNPTLEERQTALEKSVLEIVETLGVPQSGKIKDLLNDVEI